jgi:hypothetical protein
VNNGDHRFPLNLGIPVGQGYRDLLVKAKDGFRLIVATVVDYRVMDPTKACPRVEGRILNIEGLHHVHNNVRPVLGLFLFDSPLCFCHCYPPLTVLDSILTASSTIPATL